LQNVFFLQNDGSTPLHISVIGGDEAMIKLLYLYKACPDICDKVFNVNYILPTLSNAIQNQMCRHNNIITHSVNITDIVK